MDNSFSKIFKQKLHEVLKAFDLFCNNNNLNYYACSGTAIGAVRHHDIIPWDDDVDVFMPRSDYDKFLELRQTLKETNYGVKCLGDCDYIYGFAKFYDKRTTLIELEIFPSCLLGVYIDVFPLDFVSSSIDDLQEKMFEYRKKYRRFQFTYYKPTIRNTIGNIIHFRVVNIWDIITCCLCSKKQKEKIRRDFIAFDKKWREDEGEYLICHVGKYPIEKELMKKEWFVSYQYVPFGDERIRINNNCDDYLKHLWGDYMKCPPIKLQKSHHYHYYINFKEGLTLKQVENRIKNGEYLVM